MELGTERADHPVHLDVEALDRGRELVDVVQVHPQHQRVVGTETSFQGPPQLRDLRPHPGARQPGEGIDVADAGAIVRANYYGRGKVLGFYTEGGLDIVFTRQIGFRLSGGFNQIGYQFTGKGGTQGNSRDGNPDNRDVGGAADRVISAAGTLSVTY